MYLRSAEKFDFGRTWKLIAPLPSFWNFVSCIIHKDHIYISGGASRDIDIYHPETNSYEVMWRVLPFPYDYSVIMMTVSGQHYIFFGKDFLRLDCDQRTC